MEGIEKDAATIIDDILEKDPFRAGIMDSSDFVKRNDLQEITSASIFEPNARVFHPEGLFSEVIFGDVVGTERYTTMAYIDLHTDIINPEVYRALMTKRRLYKDIMNGSSTVVFDEETHDFVLSDSEDADTGYSFFMSYLDRLGEGSTTSLRKRPIYEMLRKYKGKLTISKYLVLPAGLRDIRMDTTRLEQDDVNKVYLGLLNITKGIADYDDTTDRLFDSMRYNIQTKVMAIHQYILDIIGGKTGYLNRTFGDRSIAFGTRNVVSCSITATNSPNDAATLQFDETKLPIVMVIKEFQVFVISFLKNNIFDMIHTDASTTVKVLDPKTFAVVYAEITPREMKSKSTSAGLTDIINMFTHHHFRETDVVVTDKEGKNYPVLLVYDIGHKVFIFTVLDEGKTMVEKHDVDWDVKKIRSITWTELMYIATTSVSAGKHSLSSRYPVIEDGSIYPSGVKVVSTTEDREVEVVYGLMPPEKMYHYPILGKPHVDTMIVHPSRLAALGMDYDGDTGGSTGLWSKESNAEIREYLDSYRSIIGDDMRMKVGGNDDIIAGVVRHMSR